MHRVAYPSDGMAWPFNHTDMPGKVIIDLDAQISEKTHIVKKWEWREWEEQQWWGLKRETEKWAMAVRSRTRYAQIWFLKGDTAPKSGRQGYETIQRRWEMRLSGGIEWWGKAMISGIRFEKKNGSRFEKKNNNVEDRKRECAPFERRICWWGSLFQLLYRDLRLRQNEKYHQCIIRDQYIKKKEKIRETPALTIQKPNKLLIIHTRTDFDTNWIPNPPKIFHMCTRHLSRSVSDPKKVCSGIVKCIFLHSPRCSIFIIDSSNCSIGRATRDRKFPC